MKVRFDPKALRNLDGILSYVAKRDASAAKRLADRILKVISRLERHPLSARGRKSDGAHILVIPGTRYVAIYRVKGDEVHILQIFHTAQNFPR